jgi:hypothetical protein
MHFKTGLRGKIKEFLERNKIYKNVKFEGAGIPQEMFDWISAQIPKNSNVLEFGAGYASTKALSSKFNLYSVEHDPKFLGVYNSNYIYAPLDPKYGWYSTKNLEEVRLISPKLVLIDGPPGTGKRFGILKNLDLIKGAEIIVVDDTNRPSERLLVDLLADQLGMTCKNFQTWSYLSHPEISRK